MKGCCDEDECVAEWLELAGAVGWVVDRASELFGVMAADRRRGAPLLAWAMREVERDEAAAVLVKRPWLGNLDIVGC